METRMEKQKRLKKKKRIEFLKVLIVLIFMVIGILGLKEVNKTIIDLECMENPNLLNYDTAKGELDFLGGRYIMDFRILKRID